MSRSAGWKPIVAIAAIAATVATMVAVASAGQPVGHGSEAGSGGVLSQAGAVKRSEVPGDVGAFADPSCPDQFVCSFSLGDYAGTKSTAFTTGPGATAFSRIVADNGSGFMPARSAKNKFNQRVVVYANKASDGTFKDFYCVPADTNRPGPFAERDWFRSKAVGDSC